MEIQKQNGDLKNDGDLKTRWRFKNKMEMEKQDGDLKKMEI